VSFAVWLTGPPASGKSTIARAALALLADEGVRAVTLESDVMRKILTPEPTYSREERDRFYAELADLAALLVAQGFPVIVDATGPRRAHRERGRKRIARFVEVSVAAPLAVREARDPKGLYRNGRRGLLANLPGLDETYEEARHPELTLDGQADAEESARRMVALLRERGDLTTRPEAALPRTAS
jgi:adenylylsulfate kinase